jgi:hypothetical protein
MEGVSEPRISSPEVDRSRRFPASDELDKLWTWVCGSPLGGGYVRGGPAEIAKALGVTVKVLDRLMDGRASFQVSTLQKVMGRIDALIRIEQSAGEKLAKLSWSAEDNTAAGPRGRYFARYRAGDAWAYLTGCGDGYATAMEARHAAAKMHALMHASPEAFSAA